MEGISSSGVSGKANGKREAACRAAAGGFWGGTQVGDPKIERFFPRRNHDPKDLRSWAKRTGFVSGESAPSIASADDEDADAHKGRFGFDLEKGAGERGDSSLFSPKIEIDPVVGRARVSRTFEIESDWVSKLAREKDGSSFGLRDGRVGRLGNQDTRVSGRPVLSTADDDKRDGFVKGNDDSNDIVNSNGNGHAFSAPDPAVEPKKHENDVQEEMGVNVFHDPEGPILGRLPKKYELKFGIVDNLGLVPRTYYGLQQYLSLVGSLVLIPLVIVPAMGGNTKDMSNVISSMLLVSGITTLLHSYFGTRLPLVQGSSFVFLAPALVIVNSEELRDLTEHKFRQIMRELQGSIIVGSVFQCILGFSGLMSLLLRWINPVVVASTTMSIGLAFFSYGFPQAGSCVEISIPQICLVIMFTLYLRGISIYGHQVFRIYAVPLSIVIIWTYAFFLTVGGAYNYKGCSSNVPTSNILVDACRKHSLIMKNCRTDVSDALNTSSWFRVPYPFQWGIPIFKLRTTIIMIFVSLVSSVDSVGTYHSTSLRVNSKPPTPGVVSRGIGVEGFCSILAGLWGTGTGSTTLAENMHTINATKVANRGAIQLGAAFLILLSVVGKVCGILASIPQALAASVLCFTWAVIVALGLSTLQYGQASNYRNMAIVGVSLFLGFSIPAYFQQYEPNSSLVLPGYLLPYSSASSGPLRTGMKELDFALNSLLSMNMVVTFLIAFLLDNTVPGTRQDRGVYAWSSSEDLRSDPASQDNYAMPRRLAGIFCWSKCLRL